MVYSSRKSFKKRFQKKIPIWKKRWLWYSLSIIAITIGTVYFLFFSKFLQIAEIKITGNQKLAKIAKKQTEQKLEEPFFIFWKKNNILLFNSNALQAKILQEIPELKTASIKKILPNSLYLTIEERQAMAVWQSKQAEYFLIDKDGFIFNSPDFESDYLPLIINETIAKSANPIQPITSEEMQKILLIWQTLKNIPLQLNSLNILDDRLEAKITEGWKIDFNLSGDIELDLIKVKLLLEKEIIGEKRKNLEYIDLRFNKTYYK